MFLRRGRDKEEGPQAEMLRTSYPFNQSNAPVISVIYEASV